MTTYFSNYGPEQRAMVEQWLAQMRRRFAGARDASDIDRMLARERHLETLDRPMPMPAQRLAKLEAEVPDVRGEGPFLLVADCGETGSKVTRFVRRFATLEELQEAKRQVDTERCGPGCWRNHLLYRLVQRATASVEQRADGGDVLGGTPPRPDDRHRRLPLTPRKGTDAEHAD